MVVTGVDPISKEAQRNATVLFMSLVRSTMASKRVLSEYKLNSVALSWVLGEIVSKFQNALASPGKGQQASTYTTLY